MSRERVRMELLKLLLARHATPALVAMAESGLLIPVLGGVPDLAGFENMAKVEMTAGVQADAKTAKIETVVRRAVGVTSIRGLSISDRCEAP